MRLRRHPDQETADRLNRLLAAGPPARTEPATVPDPGWIVRAPVEPRPELDKLHGWVPDRPAGLPERSPEPAAEREMDDLDRFLASQGLDGLGDVDSWNVDPDPEDRQGWWTRLSVPWRAAVALLVVGALALAVVAYRSLSGERPGTVTPVPRRTAPVGSGTASPATTASATASAGATTSARAAGPVMVYVTGQVRRPGVVRLPATGRVDDAIRAAGGLTARADAESVNLARVVQDGEQIRVPRPGEQVAAAPAPAQSSGGATAGASMGAAGAAGGKVNLNTATLADLDQLDGVGPVLAQRILDYRTQHGPFANVQQLNDVSGIGEKLMSRIGPQVTV